MANISDFKRVRSLIREKTSNKILLTIIAFIFALLVITSSLTNFHYTNSVKLKLLDFSSHILKSLYMPLSTFKNSGENINNIISVYENNKKLVLENENLKSQLIETKNIKTENLELRNLLSLKKEIDYSFVTAKIISQNNTSFVHSLILLSGIENKISLKSPVVYKNNLVGYISDLGNKSSRVTLVSDITSKVPAMILDKNTKFIISGNNSNFLEVLNYGDTKLFEIGDEVYTSGDGNRYPKGLLIGKIIKDSEGNFLIDASINISKLNYVQVIDWSPKSRGIDIKINNILDE